jgi:hypothetical protein
MLTLSRNCTRSCWKTGLPPRRLEIEITETALVRGFNRALAALRLIKALGIRIAMDDFGTGYAALRGFSRSKGRRQLGTPVQRVETLAGFELNELGDGRQ